MKTKASVIAAAALLLLAAGPALAGQNVVGFNRVVAQPGTDVLLTAPFTAQAEGTFTVASKTTDGVTVSAALTAGQYAGAYYVRFTSGGGEGLWTTITSNGTGSITFEEVAVLDHIGTGDQFRIYKHHTLGSLFARTMYDISYTNGTQIYIYDNGSLAQNRSSAKAAAYSKALGRWAGAGVNNDTILKPETQFILRNNAAYELQIVMHGLVADYKVSALVQPSGDLVIGTGYPVPVVLKDAGLEGNQRQVYIYNNDAVGINKSASKVAAYSIALGRWVGAGITGDELLKPSEALVLRLPAGETATMVTISKPY